MASVTVPGTGHSTIALSFDSAANAAVAKQIAGEIAAAVQAGSMIPADNSFGPPPTLPAGVQGEFIQSLPGVTFLPNAYTAVVNDATSAVVFGSSLPDQRVLSGDGTNLTYFAAGGSGSVAAGGGDNMISIPSTDPGNWLVVTGNGNDTIRALGGGNDTISPGGGSNAIQLGSGNSYLGVSGADTILASTGSETVAAADPGANTIIYSNASTLFFMAGAGATVYGGTGSNTVLGGTGSTLAFGGSAGNNFLQGGSGPSTLFGAANGDQLFAGGSGPQALHAGAGNETLFGGFGDNETLYGGSGSVQIFTGGGHDTVVAGSGAATVTAGGDNTLFQFIEGAAGGTDLVTGFTDASQVHIDLAGYGPNEAQKAVAGQVNSPSGVTITLSDSTTITFQNISKLTTDNFS